MNIIEAIINLVVSDNITIPRPDYSVNSMNAMGTPFEMYIKDLFSCRLDRRIVDREQQYQNTFSYTGNMNNPPDAIIRGGDAIEVKKVSTLRSTIQLNSSHPKQFLKCADTRINSTCRNAELWTEKDIIYAVGVQDGSKVRHLSLVYGRDYCASEQVYTDLANAVKHNVEAVPGYKFAPTNELGHINNVDPLSITYFRARPMWVIDNPLSVFSYVYTPEKYKKFTMMCIINDEKWAALEHTDQLLKLAEKCTALHVNDVFIKNPDTNVQNVPAKLITYYIE